MFSSSPQGEICVRGNGLSEFLKTICTQIHIQADKCIYFPLKGSKVKKKLGIITMKRDEAANDAVCASESFSIALV